MVNSSRSQSYAACFSSFIEQAYFSLFNIYKIQQFDNIIYTLIFFPWLHELKQELNIYQFKGAFLF